MCILNVYTAQRDAVNFGTYISTMTNKGLLFYYILLYSIYSQNHKNGTFKLK